MEAIFKVKDKKLFDSLMVLLKSLKVEVKALDKKTIRSGTFKSEKDFFSIAGIWSNRNITKESLREKAWPKKK